MGIPAEFGPEDPHSAWAYVALVLILVLIAGTVLAQVWFG